MPQYLAWPGNVRGACPLGELLGPCSHCLFICPRARRSTSARAMAYGLREKTRVWKSGRSVAETRSRSFFWVYMTYRDLVMAALSCWWLICDF